MNPEFQHEAYVASRVAIQAARRNASATLSTVFPNAMTDSIVPAIDQAMKLCQEAVRLMPQMQQSHTKDKAVAELKKRCPGYNDKTYEAAVMDAFTDYIR